MMDSNDRLNRRLSILKELRTVTGTMRGLSAVNGRHFANAARAVSEHDTIVDMGFKALALNSSSDLMQTKTTVRQQAHLIILFGTDHRLCGRFNERVVEQARDYAFSSANNTTTLKALLDPDNNTGAGRLLVAGHIASEICASADLTPHATMLLPGVVDNIPDLVRDLILRIDSWMRDFPDTEIDVFHHRAVEESGIEVVHTQLLPMRRVSIAASANWPSYNLPAISVTPHTLLAALIREHLFVGLYRSCAESQAAEHMSRLASMQAACRNIDEQISDVGRELRKYRQAAITSELLDTVAGYESIVRSR